MSSFDDLKVTFFDEANEGLVALEAGLTDIQEGTGSDDTVNAIFRAVHSIKGGAGVFGFTELIGFAHVFETVLDAIRLGSLGTTPDVLDVLLRANDTLTDLVGMVRTGKAIDPSFGNESRAALQELIGSSDKGDGHEGPAEEDLGDFTFTPVRVDDDEDAATADAGPTMRSYSIAFRPKPEMLQKGINPLDYLNCLRSMGEVEIVAETDAIPTLSDVKHDHAYIGWTVALKTVSDREQLDAVFAPIVEDCEITVTELRLDSASEPAPSEPVVGEPAAPVVLEAPKASEAPVAVAAASIEQTSEEAAAAPPAPPPAAGSDVKPHPAAAGEAAANSKEAKEAKEAKSGAPKAAGTTIRVELEKIDRVVNMVGELVIAQAMLGQVIENLPEEVSGKVATILGDLVRHTRGLKDSVMAIRAQPVSSIFQRMPRLVRELAAKTAKKVQVEMIGETTEVDKTIIERLSDPLTHIIRNSIDHGIELPADRLTRGKSEMGTIRLCASQRGGRIVIEISDDGAGINCERVLKKARDKGLIDPNLVLSDEEICNLVFLPGFSTAETVSDISGRGVGMDVVRRNIQDLGGRTTIKSDAGKGMMIQLTLPLTLAVMDGMVVQVGDQTYVIPIPNIVECLRPSGNDIHQLLGTSGTLRLRGDVVPLIRLGDLLGVAGASKDKKLGVVIITEASDGTRLGFIVDELCGHQQVVIKSIEENCGAVQGIAGATILGDGEVAFILDVEMLSAVTSGESSETGATSQKNRGGAAVAA